jgi:short-subunit dehydrogenase
MFIEKYGPWAVVAGGSDGIGAAFAHSLAQRGCNLLLLGRSQDKLDAVTAAITSAGASDVEVRSLACDLSDESAPERVAQAAASLDVGCMVYNVGAETQFGDFLDQDWDFLKGRLQRNFVTKAALIHHFGRRMRERGRGGVVLMGSLAGYSGNPGFALYSSSKGFTRVLAESLWYEFEKYGVDVICPVVGPTDTPSMVDAYGPVKGYGPVGGAMSPAVVSESALNNLGSLAVWVADDIVDQVATMESMAPEERTRLAARYSEKFTRPKDVDLKAT